tara:strand:- start:148 stop:726 length:579 start_codon:yes stop_codon:yes gene_type:complete
MKYLFFFIILFFPFQQIAWSKGVLNEFLVAKPHMMDTRFKETVIVMFMDNDKGAAGLVVNKPIKTIKISEFLKGSNNIFPNEIIDKDITLYWGGPVNPENFYFIHSSDYKSNDFIISNKDYTITRTKDIIYDIARNIGPKNFIILSGVSVWSPGQLDFEMYRGDWDKRLNSYIPIFDNGKQMWIRLISSKEI